uniref:Integrase catalytic domain-containing protein n=1 Tax=Plectus sambesii TaxID=2011161 RepID=A0A914VEZ9_9BILA
MKQKGLRYCYWPSFGRDVENYASRCKPCSLAQKDLAKMTVPWKQCDRPWQRVHIDHAGPFKDGSYLLILVDAYSKWIEASIVRSTSTEATISALAAICARFGWPEQLVADNAKGFASSEFCDFLTKKGTERLLIAPQSPWLNSIMERAVRTTKAALEKSKTNGGTLHDHLNAFLEMYRTTPNANDDRSLAERLLWWQPRGPLDALTTATKVVEPTKQESTATPARTFQAGQRVTVWAWTVVVAHRNSAVQYTAWPDRCDKYADQDSWRVEEKKRSPATTKAQMLKSAEKRQQEVEEEETLWIYLQKSPITAPLANLVLTPPPVFQPEDRDQNESGNDHDPTPLQEDEPVADNDESSSTALSQLLRRSTRIRRQPNPYWPDFYQSD